MTSQMRVGEWIEHAPTMSDYAIDPCGCPESQSRDHLNLFGHSLIESLGVLNRIH